MLIYVHGTNGSGKSTLARAILADAGGVDPYGLSTAEPLSMRGRRPKPPYTVTNTEGLVLVGGYGTACGGVDGLSPYSSIFEIVKTNAGYGRKVFAEGLITPGLETCKRLAGMVDTAAFVFLDTPVEQCVENVIKRRRAKGNTKPFDPDNLLKKRRSAVSWASRLEESGLPVVTLKWNDAYAFCTAALGLKPGHPFTHYL